MVLDLSSTCVISWCSYLFPNKTGVLTTVGRVTTVWTFNLGLAISGVTKVLASGATLVNYPVTVNLAHVGASKNQLYGLHTEGQAH